MLTSSDSQYEFEISLSCQGLPNDSSGLAPNTYAIVQSQNEHEAKWISNGHTETVEVRCRVAFYSSTVLPMLGHELACHIHSLTHFLSF